MNKVLVLSAGFGNGHNAAAFNIRDGLEAVSEDVRVEVLDLFKLCYGKKNDLVKKLFLGIVQYAPKVWEGMYSVLDRTSVVEKHLGRLTKLRQTLHDLLKTTEPDAVVCTYPAYNYVIADIYRNHRERPFALITVVTDSITVNSVWHGAPADAYIVANDPTAEVMRRAGVPAEKLHVLGFPVSPRFQMLAEQRNGDAESPKADDAKRVFYIIHHGKKKAGRIIEELLEIPELRLTITCGTDAELKGRLIERTRRWEDRVEVLGWTNRMPDFLASSHLVITKAGGAIVQEAIAAGCPLLVNQIIPGQEEGNARLVELLGIGAVAKEDADLTKLVRDAFAAHGRQWRAWRKAIQQHSRPDASLRIAEFILQECQPGDPDDGERLVRLPTLEKPAPPASFHVARPTKPLLCDFHTHTNYSDGKLTVAELVDFYGRRGFDCLCITDHIAERKRLVGKLANLSNLTLPWNQVAEYLDVIEQEKKRAWRRYGMVLMAGLEFNKDGLSKKSSTHLLGIDLKGPISPDLGMKKLIAAIHLQGGLAVASHPHEGKSLWGRDTLFLWENQDEFAPLLDAWEIANRDDLYNPVGLKRLPFLANSDFHKPSHIYSWKTMLNCEKHPEAIKQCIRDNRNISILLYRDALNAADAPMPVFIEPPAEQMLLPLRREKLRAAQA